MDLLTKRLFIEGHPRVGEVVIMLVDITIVVKNVMSMVMMRILRTVMLMLFRELALAEVEVFKVLDHIKAEESSGNLYK